jgi:hypothetical protein
VKEKFHISIGMKVRDVSLKATFLEAQNGMGYSPHPKG